MNESLEFHVTKVEDTKKGFLVTIKDNDQTRQKHRVFSQIVLNPQDYPIGQIVDLVFVPRK